mgnify:CR=1 FL=1
MDCTEDGGPIPLTVRLAVACMFLAGAHIRKGKPGHMAPLTYALRLWQSLAAIPVSKASVVSIERAVVLVPFSAYQ